MQRFGDSARNAFPDELYATSYLFVTLHLIMNKSTHRREIINYIELACKVPRLFPFREFLETEDLVAHLRDWAGLREA
jgi:hypothetical protein